MDSPVGAGFSFADDEKYLCKNNLEVATDLIELLKGFYNKHPEFEVVPFYIFSESFAGKQATEFAWKLHKEIKSERIKCNLKAVALGSPFISPKDSELAHAPFLYQMVNFKFMTVQQAKKN